jgi:hypothetical protein
MQCQQGSGSTVGFQTLLLEREIRRFPCPIFEPHHDHTHLIAAEGLSRWPFAARLSKCLRKSS